MIGLVIGAAVLKVRGPDRMESFISVYGIIMIGIGYVAIGKNIQIQHIKKNRITTQLFSNFLHFIYSGSAFTEGGGLISDTIKKARKSSLKSGHEIQSIDHSYYIKLSDTVDVRGCDATSVFRNSSSNGREKRNYIHRSIVATVFEHPRFVADTPVYIIPNKQGKKTMGEIIPLEDKEFEAIWSIRAEDSLLARIVATPSVMMIMNEYAKQHGNDQIFVVWKNTIIVIEKKKSSLEKIVKINYNKNINSQLLGSYTSFLKKIDEIIELSQVVNVDYHDASGSLQ